MYERLVAYKMKHKDTNVPQRYPGLGRWVANQRFRKKKMTEERKRLLDYIGFVWVERHQEPALRNGKKCTND